MDKASAALALAFGIALAILNVLYVPVVIEGFEADPGRLALHLGAALFGLGLALAGIRKLRGARRQPGRLTGTRQRV